MSAGGLIAQALLGATGSAAQGVGQRLREEAKLKRQQTLDKTRTQNNMQERTYQAELDAKAPTTAAKARRELVASGMDEQQARDTAYGVAPKKPLTINNQLIDPNTGKVLGDYRDPEKKSGMGGKAPADVQTAEWMVANKLAPNLDAAYTRVNESRTDPARFVNDFVTQELKYQETAGLMQGDAGYRTPEQLREQAIETLNMIRARTRGMKQGQAADPEAEPRPEDLKVFPEDGSAVPQGDGSYSGLINRGTTQPKAPPPPSTTQTPEQIRADFRAGKISKEEAVSALKYLGYE